MRSFATSAQSDAQGSVVGLGAAFNGFERLSRTGLFSSARRRGLEDALAAGIEIPEPKFRPSSVDAALLG